MGVGLGIRERRVWKNKTGGEMKKVWCGESCGTLECVGFEL